MIVTLIYNKIVSNHYKNYKMNLVFVIFWWIVFKFSWIRNEHNFGNAANKNTKNI